jgi:hypothetical protein
MLRGFDRISGPLRVPQGNGPADGDLSRPQAIRRVEIQWAAKNKKLLKRSCLFILFTRKTPGIIIFLPEITIRG